MTQAILPPIPPTGVSVAGNPAGQNLFVLYQSDGGGGWLPPVACTLQNLAALLAPQLALAVSMGTTNPVVPIGNVLIVPDTCVRALVSAVVDISEIRFASHITDAVMPPNGTELEIILVNGGSVFGGPEFPSGPASVVIEALNGAWFVKSHS